MFFKKISPLDFIIVLILATPFLMVLSRNIATLILVVVALLSAGAGFSFNKDVYLLSIRRIASSRATLIVVAIIALMLMTLMWSPSMERGFGAVINLVSNLAFFAIAIALATAMILRASLILLNRYWMSAAIVAAAGLIIVELIFGSPIRAFLGGSVGAYRMNRAAVAIVLFLPLALTLLPRDKSGGVVCVITTVALFAAVFASKSTSAQLAFLVLVMLQLACIAFHSKTIWLLASVTLISLVLLPFISPIILGFVPDQIEELIGYGSLGVRAEIWSAYSSLLENAPFLGHGMEASNAAAVIYEYAELDNRLLDFGHPHNFAIQVWYELGVVGVILFSVLIVMYFRSLCNVPDNFIPAILSTTAAVWTVSLVSHGAWQAWWWSLVGLLALLWVIVLRTQDTDGSNNQQTLTTE
ncbi:MAG: O-antigen ligase family protein [Roseibium sp.]